MSKVIEDIMELLKRNEGMIVYSDDKFTPLHLRDTVQYQALKDSIKPDACKGCGADLSKLGSCNIDCPVPKPFPKKPEKQTLIKFMDKRAGYIPFSGQTKEAFERREVYRNISEYLEQN